MSPRRTGSWVVERKGRFGTSWLLGGSADLGSVRAWFAWGGIESAHVYPTKTAARAALRAYRRRERASHDDVAAVAVPREPTIASGGAKLSEHATTDAACGSLPLEPVEISWLVWVAGEQGSRRLLGRGTLAFDELVGVAVDWLHADLEQTAKLPPPAQRLHAADAVWV